MSVLVIVMTQLPGTAPGKQAVSAVLGTLIACWGNVSVPGVTVLATGTPVPLSPMVCGLRAELSVKHEAAGTLACNAWSKSGGNRARASGR